MTDKRFIPIFDGTDKRVVGSKDNGKIISFMDMFDLLNDLSDENEQLRKENDMLSCELSVSANKEISRNCRIAELEKENEELKQYNVELVKNQKLKDDKNQHLLDLLCCNPIIFSPRSIGYDNIYHRTSKQLENHLKDNGFLVDTVSRSSVGDLSFYRVEFNLSDDEWEYEKTTDFKIRELLGIRNVGLVDFYEQGRMVHEVILVSEQELNDKYLKDGNLVF